MQSTIKTAHGIVQEMAHAGLGLWEECFHLGLKGTWKTALFGDCSLGALHAGQQNNPLVRLEAGGIVIRHHFLGLCLLAADMPHERNQAGSQRGPESVTFVHTCQPPGWRGGWRKGAVGLQ